MGVTIPPSIASDPVLSELWEQLAPEGNRFVEQDVPLLEQLCYWHAVARQAREAISRGDGHIAVFERIGTKPYKAENGKAVPMYRKNVALSVLKEASAEIRSLSSELGLSPSARAKMGASAAPAPKSANASLLDRMFSARGERERKAHGA